MVPSLSIHLPGDAQNLSEQRRQLGQEAFAKRTQRIMIGLLVGGDVAKGNRVMSGGLDAPARIHAGGVAVNEQAQHHRRMVGRRAGTPILFGQRRQIQLINDVDYKARQMIFAQPVIDRGWQQKRRSAIYRTEVGHSYSLATISRTHL
jgi:hypothetical protein